MQSVKFAKVSAIVSVPAANCLNSDKPRGPFHITVLAFLTSSTYALIVSVPISNPCQPSGISLQETILLSVSGANSFPTFVSVGNINLTPFCFAFSINSFAKSSLSNSHIESPTPYPCALKNVYAIAPPIIKVSTFSNKLFITPILSETFLPPNIATNGLFGFSNAEPKNLSSFSIKNPDTAGKYSAIPAVELCALCAVPNASFTNISAIDASSFENSGSFFSSLGSNLTFSNNTISPFFMFEVNSFALSPTTSFASLTSLPNNLDSSFATGANENSGLTSPFGLPR